MPLSLVLIVCWQSAIPCFVDLPPHLYFHLHMLFFLCHVYAQVSPLYRDTGHIGLRTHPTSF